MIKTKFDYSFVDESDFCSSVQPRVVECEPAQPLGVDLGHDLEAFDDAAHVLVLQHGVLA